MKRPNAECGMKSLSWKGTASRKIEAKGFRAISNSLGFRKNGSP
jgi:hypothetical protein